jgi:Trp operon repressor
MKLQGHINFECLFCFVISTRTLKTVNQNTISNLIRVLEKRFWSMSTDLTLECFMTMRTELAVRSDLTVIKLATLLSRHANQRTVSNVWSVMIGWIWRTSAKFILRKGHLRSNSPQYWNSHKGRCIKPLQRSWMLKGWNKYFDV